MRPSIPSRLILACSIAALVAGCVSKAPVMDSKLGAAQLHDKAIVIVSVTVDPSGTSETQGTFFMDTGTSGAVRLPASRTVLDPPISNDFGDRIGHVYVLEVPPGHHAFTTWIVHSGQRNGQPPSSIAPLAFDIARGEVLYLGNLDLQLAMRETRIRHDQEPYAAFAQVRDLSRHDIAVAERTHPAVAGHARVALLPLGPWGRAANAPAMGAPGD
jgi:hypothetical protein